MKRLLAAVLVLAALAFAGWWGFWSWATGRAEAALDGFIQQEKTRGREWACAERRMTGFPKSFEFVCERPSVTIAQISGPPAIWRLQRVTASAQATRVTSARVLLDGPATLERGDLPPVRVEWSFLEVGLTGLPSPTRVSVLSDGPRLIAEGAPPLSAESVKASVDLASTPTFRLPPGGARLGLEIGALSYPPLAAIIRTPTLNLEMHGDLAKATALATPGGTPARLEAWRLAEGRLNLHRIRVWSSQPDGPTITGDARLALDDEHRLEGQADLAAKGLGELARAFGLPDNAVSIGGLLGNLLTGADKKSVPLEPGMTPLPLRFAKGALWYGPVKTPVRLPPIY